MERFDEAHRSSASSSSSSSLSDNDDLSGSLSGNDSGDNIDPIENSSHRGGGDSSFSTEIKEIETLARHDTQMLRTWRTIVLLILLGTFAAVTAGTFIFIQKQQNDDDEQSVRLLVTKFVKVFPRIPILYLTSLLHSLVRTICSHRTGHHQPTISSIYENDDRYGTNSDFCRDDNW
jgi:hypothetical protein